MTPEFIIHRHTKLHSFTANFAVKVASQMLLEDIHVTTRAYIRSSYFSHLNTPSKHLYINYYIILVDKTP